MCHHACVVGAGCLAYDQYHRKHPAALGGFAGVKHVADSSDHRALAAALRKTLTADGLKVADVVDPATGRPAWGVEYRVVPKGRTLLSIINFMKDPQTVRVNLPGKAFDLLSRRAVDLANLRLDAIVPMLIVVE